MPTEFRFDDLDLREQAAGAHGRTTETDATKMNSCVTFTCVDAGDCCPTVTCCTNAC